MSRMRSYWGWGYSDFQIPEGSLESFKTLLKTTLQVKEFENHSAISAEELKLRKSRFDLPMSLQSICSSTNYDRARHSYGMAFRDVWRGFHGHFPNPPDYVAFPKTEADIVGLMKFAYQRFVFKLAFWLIRCYGVRSST